MPKVGNWPKITEAKVPLRGPLRGHAHRLLLQERGPLPFPRAGSLGGRPRIGIVLREITPLPEDPRKGGNRPGHARLPGLAKKNEGLLRRITNAIYEKTIESFNPPIARGPSATIGPKGAPP